MQTLYTIVGGIVVWGVALLALVFGALHLWEKYGNYPKDWWAWVQVIILNRPWHLREHQAHFLKTYGKHTNPRSTWRRNVMARSIRYSKQVGWKPEAD